MSSNVAPEVPPVVLEACDTGMVELLDGPTFIAAKLPADKLLWLRFDCEVGSPLGLSNPAGTGSNPISMLLRCKRLALWAAGDRFRGRRESAGESAVVGGVPDIGGGLPNIESEPPMRTGGGARGDMTGSWGSDASPSSSPSHALAASQQWLRL